MHRTYLRPEFDTSNNGALSTVESFNLQTMEWSEEPAFPFSPVGQAANIPQGHTFLTIGGITNGSPTDNIYRVCKQHLSVMSHV